MNCEPHVAALVCAENIALNYLLHEVPEPPQQKPTEHFRGSEEEYTLSFSKEKELVEVLSFLAKTKDGSDYIPAMCVEQGLNGAALKALLAINKRTYTDGDGLLQSLKTGFENIFKPERGSSTEITKRLLEMIVQMCSSRIASRLRLTGKKRKNSKASINDILQEAIEGTRQIHPQKLIRFNLEESLLLFRAESKSVIQSVNEWSNHRVSHRLNDIVEKMYRLNNVHGLQQLLHLIPHGPTKVIKQAAFTATLLNIIRKVSRYKEAAQVLHRIAKKFPLVRNIEIQLATLPQEAFDRPHHPEYSPSLRAVLSRLGKINGKQYNVSQISRFMRNDKTKNPDEQFSEQTTRILQEAKIHAEIQLIAYCEIESPPLFPRAIASSKDACFLCHAFIQNHHKMHTSRTHGRLYPGWRLPNLLSFKTLEHRFNEILVDRARQSIRARDKGQMCARPYPNESTLLPMLISASTMSAVQDLVEITTGGVSLAGVSPGSGTVERAVSTADPPKDIKVISSCFLAPNDPFTGVITPTASSPFFQAGPLHIHLEMEESSASESTTKCLAFSIERMNVKQITKLPIGSLMLDVMELERDMTYALPADGTFCLTAHDITVKIVCKQ
ncbi:hypothetical protein N7468_004717 [Penicillium chermesinum]|uniref:Uncharacterized protein n=1 Tax=Penicillium chermesinum TaxID=63820 RepID=A0A9W9TTH8_9EURO|nr:uncharacterized protein N7468_004717 [Penicillium chermesinum]KAJ5240098.1 hypothetical protein N7468_004717 [Penicillium chermesinum]KAJ6166973.1 hypothetical protein N7470_002420 [Penicillium chermesinum]